MNNFQTTIYADPDETLVSLIRQGNSVAFGHLMERHQPYIVRIVSRFLFCREDSRLYLARKIHSKSLTSFVRRDTMQANLISEEALTRYVKDRCGYNDSDVKAVRKMLIQAGLIN